MKRIKDIILNIRYWIIEIFVGDMPVCMNMELHRPDNYDGPLYHDSNIKESGIFSKNYLYSEPGKGLLQAHRKAASNENNRLGKKK